MKKTLKSLLLLSLLTPSLVFAFPTNEQITQIYIKTQKMYAGNYSQLDAKALYKHKIISKSKNKNWQAGAFQKSFYLSIPHETIEQCDTLLDSVFKLDFVYEAKCEAASMLIQFQANDE